MRHARLSICIPTYNFGEFIGDALESIVGQATDEVEIIVGDSGSTDNTADTIERFQARFSRLTYHNFGQKSGIDRDLPKTVELAKGDYCWFISADDALRPGAIQRVLDEIALGHTVYLPSRSACDRNLRPMRRKSLWLSKDIPDTVYHFTSRSELLAYLHAAESIGALFSYLSSLVVSRERWNAIGFDERFDGSNYAHVFRVFSMLAIDGSSLKYISEPLVACRGDNDSFMTAGLAKRFLIDFEGYRLLGDTLFADDEVRSAFNGVMRRQHRWYSLSRVKSETGDAGEWLVMKENLLNCGYSHRALFLIERVGSSKHLVRASRSVKRFLETR